MTDAPDEDAQARVEEIIDGWIVDSMSERWARAVGAIVILFEPTTETKFAYGPFPDVMTAMVYADASVRDANIDLMPGDLPWQSSVVPLEPPT